ncbi:hypothetical protein [Croceicoccus marinus]|uniref:DUF2845 domain-containing protein n=1 Tax=Croceicoccus marinus TaxID=450378 RepID=A0A7G6VTE8_9SPHN|nr:hypothetical protein [Croceicoccus marinus]QNE05013.1 hypothetical protein H4O24_14065 [Croceicoccus marinus]
MKRQLFLLLGSTLSLFGCADPNAPIKMRSGKLTQTQVDQIITRCGGPSGMGVIESGSLTIKPVSDLTVTGCVLKAIYDTGETTLTTVGNERYVTPEVR